MGFKVTIRRNGAVCGEAHYKAEAVAAGMADKATKANPDVSAAVTRCNPGCSVCCGTKTNRRRNGSDRIPAKRGPRSGGRGARLDALSDALVNAYEDVQEALDAGASGATLRPHLRSLERAASAWTAAGGGKRNADYIRAMTMLATFPQSNPAARRRTVAVADIKAAVLAGADGSHLTDIARAPALRGVNFARIMAAAAALAKAGQVAYDGVTVTRTNRRRNGSDAEAKREAARSSLRAQAEANKRADEALFLALHGYPMPAYTPAQRRADERGMARMRRQRNGTTAGEMAAGRSMAYTNLFRNNGARPTFDAVRKRIFKEFGEAGWTLSSPTLKVLHATSPDGKCRAWFKAQSIYYTKGGGIHELGTAHSVTQNFDLRDVPPGIFVRWFEKNWCGPTRTNPTRRRASRSARISRRRNSGSNTMTEAQAKTVIRQLAGTLGKLVTMTGATGMYRIERDGHPALTFKFKGSKKANVVTIILMPSDTYTLQFAKMAGRTKFYEMTPTGEFSDIYAEQLQPTFERFTGLYLSL